MLMFLMISIEIIVPSREKLETKVTDDYQSSSSLSNEEIIIQESLDPSADNTACISS